MTVSTDLIERSNNFTATSTVTAKSNALYRTLWRWHFYAGMFVIPFIIILSLTGAVYLFKPQIERIEESGFRNLTVSGAVTPSVQVDAALKAFPGARFVSYRLPEESGDATLIHLGLADGETMRDVFVSPQGKVLGSLDPEWRIPELMSSIHSSLLIGEAGSWLVELAASWAIVMILTGLYLWWPKDQRRGRGLAGIVWPRRRTFIRDLHAVTGFWVAGLALVVLVSGLPWANVWGEVFKAARAQAGWVEGKQDWKTGASDHAEHDHDAMMAAQAAGLPGASLNDIVMKANSENLAFPVLIQPPGENMVWTVKSNAQNRPLRATLNYDMTDGRLLSRQTFADRHPIDRAVGYGIAWHEGQLFGLPNQLIGLATALALITLTITGFLMWRRRKPEGKLGAPPLPTSPAQLRGVAIIMLVLAALLPLLAASLLLVWLADRLLLPRLPRLARWLRASAMPSLSKF
jgi:uncharacterized iron-regulated membrane protein